MSLNKRSICNLWRQWTPWELFPFLITSHLATVHQHLQGLYYHRLQGLHNLKITHKKQDNIFIRKGTTGRARLQMTVLVTKIWVEFNYLRTVHVAAICISKLLKYQHLHSPFQRLHRPTSEAHIFFTHIAAQIQAGEAHLFFAYFLIWAVPSGQKSREMQLQTHRDPGCWGRHLSSADMALPWQKDPNITASCAYVPCNNSLKCHI